MKLGHEAWGWRFDVRLGEDGGGRVQDEGDALPRVSEFQDMAGDAETIDWTESVRKIHKSLLGV